MPKIDFADSLLSGVSGTKHRFSKEIGKQQAYIDSLKERIGQEADYAGRMRDEKYEQELKVLDVGEGRHDFRILFIQPAAQLVEPCGDVFG